MIHVLLQLKGSLKTTYRLVVDISCSGVMYLMREALAVEW